MSTSRQLSLVGEDVRNTSNQADIGNSAQTLGDLVLAFTKEELCSYVDTRIIGLAPLSRDWIVRAGETLWLISRGEISQVTMQRLRTMTLTRYSSTWSYSKTLAFAKAFLTYLTKIRLDTRYRAFDVFLEMPKSVKTRKAVTSRIITKADIENVLAQIERAKREGRITERRALEYTAFVIFGAYTGQRTMATMSRLTVGQFREALVTEKPVLQVTAEQDKIRMNHFTPLHPEVIKAVKPLLDGKKEVEKIFSYNAVVMWLKRENIQLKHINSHFVLGDLRKFAEQYGDVIGWENSNRSYVLTHGVSGVDWVHYKHPLPENVYDVYMQYWDDVEF